MYLLSKITGTISLGCDCCRLVGEFDSILKKKGSIFVAISLNSKYM